MKLIGTTKTNFFCDFSRCVKIKINGFVLQNIEKQIRKPFLKDELKQYAVLFNLFEKEMQKPQVLKIYQNMSTYTILEILALCGR